MPVIPLYPGPAPGSEDWSYAEVEESPAPPGQVGFVRNVSQPALITYPAGQNAGNGTAMIVCPGGGFHGLTIYHEGYDVARWLQQRGVSAFVLKYRVVRTPESFEEYARQLREMRAKPFEESDRRIEEVTREVRSLAVADGLQAVKLVRKRAAEWGIRPNQIGMIGFSAGGYVAGSAAVSHDVDGRPDYVGVIYGALLRGVTVSEDAPPLFMALTDKDEIASEPSLDLYSAWRRAGHPVEMHVYARGKHGFGMKKEGLPTDGWIDRFWEWLKCLQAEQERSPGYDSDVSSARAPTSSSRR